MADLVQRGHFATPVDPAAVRMAWSNEGYSCHSLTDRPGQAWRGFVHDTNEYVTVVEGRLAVTISGETVEAGPGDLVFIPRAAPHDVVNIGGSRTHWLFGYD
jgi:mannose-6-phosphate isomerase-like protein (cupin superfamily)